MSSLPERIKKRRLSLGLTLVQVANALGVKEATAQRYESGQIKNVKHDTIYKLSKILKCEPSYLMGWTDNPNFSDDSPNLTPHEKKLVTAYRNKPEMQTAVDRLLDINNKCETSKAIAEDICETLKRDMKISSNITK